MNKFIAGSSFLFASLFILTGCKPTEKNYKAAYDAALSKRQAESEDPDLNLPAEGYTRLGEPEKKEINGKTYFYKFQHLHPLSEGVEMQPYNVAVSVYKMPTNCQSQVRDLCEAGYDAFGTRTGDDRYYTIVGSYPTIEEAAEAVDNYMRKHKDSIYVGLEGAPVILRCK